MLRYYPSFRIKTNLVTQGTEYRLGPNLYKGKYYLTYDGRAFSGPNPVIGPNEELTKVTENYVSDLDSNEGLVNSYTPENLNFLPPQLRVNYAAVSRKGAPTPYFPFVIEADYKKGYLVRSFVKKVNDKGFVIEISSEEYANLKNGTVNYDVSDYLSIQIFWKITGPLNTVRVSQYDIRNGIIDTNKRLVENANKTFLGITDFIGGDYTKFARPS